MAEIIEPSQYQDFTLETLTTPSGIARLNSILGTLAKNISSDGEAVRVFQGYGTPEGAVAAGVGSLYMRVDGGADTSVYRKESGSADTGWVAITAPASLPLSLANGGTGVALSDPGADRILFWDDSAGQVTWLVPNTNLSISTTNLNATTQVSPYSDGTLIEVTASTVRNVANDAFTKGKELTPVIRNGTISVSYEAENLVNSADVRMYINGSAVGALNTKNSAGYTTYTDTGVTVVVGDVIQVYGKATTPGSGATVNIKNLKILCSNPTVIQEASGY